MKKHEFEKCAGCGKGMGNAGAVHFYRIEVEQFVLDAAAIQRQHGLEMMTGSAAVASALGPDEDLAVSMGKRHALVCAECCMLPVVAFMDGDDDD